MSIRIVFSGRSSTQPEHYGKMAPLLTELKSGDRITLDHLAHRLGIDDFHVEQFMMDLLYLIASRRVVVEVLPDGVGRHGKTRDEPNRDVAETVRSEILLSADLF